MIEAYSTNISIGANANVPFNSTYIQKGCTAVKTGVDTFSLNKKGVYMVAVDGSTATSTTLQLYKDGVAQPQAQSTGLSPSFVTLVQVDHDNNECCCTSPTQIHVQNTVAGTFTDVNITITKVC